MPAFLLIKQRKFLPHFILFLRSAFQKCGRFIASFFPLLESVAVGVCRHNLIERLKGKTDESNEKIIRFDSDWHFFI